MAFDLDDDELEATRKLHGVGREKTADEIKVGDYVRLKKGEIFKADENTTNYYNSNKEYITNEIVKHSSNIIDLIEVGDYVNGFVVRAKDTKNIYWDFLKKSFPYEIGNIVTKEQFEAIEYKVKEY